MTRGSNMTVDRTKWIILLSKKVIAHLAFASWQGGARVMICRPQLTD